LTFFILTFGCLDFWIVHFFEFGFLDFGFWIFSFLDFYSIQENLLSDIDSSLLDKDTITVSMHFRLGDYKSNTDYHPIVGLSYYINCLKFLEAHYSCLLIFYFHEDEDTSAVEQHIRVLKEHFVNFEFQRGGVGKQDWEQMLWMSQCDHHIIANSTFSWWGAYLSNNDDGMIFYPNTWFGWTSANNMPDMFPKNWNCINS
jgi:hypothetical protein